MSGAGPRAWLLRLWAAWPLALLLLAFTAPQAVRAHEISMAELQVQEVAPGRFIWQWTAGVRSGADVLEPRFPAGCAVAPGQVDCPAGRMVGALAVDGIGSQVSAVLVRLHWLDGGLRVYTLTKAQTEVQLYGSATDKRGAGDIAWAYAVLGVEHILIGIDHLLFVVGLLFLVGFERRLIWVISAFTLAHSLTLAASALGWLTLRSAPVEATIALSIMLVAAEALHRRQTLSRRWPALVALLFGLVHGLGFAGALQAIGLPEHHLLLALLAFNVGVEAGQLLVVGLLWAAWRLLRGVPAFVSARVPALYAIGGIAAYWTIGRVVAIAG